ncbi:16S rRNA (guanine(527)-N(7))-methyltransferase RsmG [Rhodovulum imhoffii]|nr:16S rRNA (guanine(527)-N(7))-methyltransferase RsmG [Rhodovulum imhoffii]MBK5934030.1 16S rRNA (guanine(527)-N(7))-methyltransferase RsmG [Rhodovulum imhoffii]
MAQRGLPGQDVSRETLERLHHYEGLLRKWNSTINLVSRSTIDSLWDRHFLDSAQIFSLVQPKGLWADLGSGGGFPGLVVSILAAERKPDLRVMLVESDLRKSIFLRTVVRELDLNALVLAERAEAVSPLGAAILSARALAPLAELLTFAERHLRPDGTAVFPKGARFRAELDAALASWRFDVQTFPSQTNPDAVILKIGGISRV